MLHRHRYRRWRIIGVASLALLTILLLLMHNRIGQDVPTDATPAVALAHVNLRSHISAKPKRQLESVCFNFDCLADLLQSLPAEASVPAIRHVIIRNQNQLDAAAPALLSWRRQHPKWRFMIWNEEHLDRAMDTFFPKFDQASSGFGFELRARMFQFLIVQKYGGVYADASLPLMQNLEPLRRFGAVFWTKRMHNYDIDLKLFMAKPQHPFVQHCNDWQLTNGAIMQMENLLKNYKKQFSVARHPLHAVQVAGFALNRPFGQEELDAAICRSRGSMEASKECNEIISDALRSSIINVATFAPISSEIHNITAGFIESLASSIGNHHNITNAHLKQYFSNFVLGHPSD